MNRELKRAADEYQALVTKTAAGEAATAKKILALFKKHFKYVRVSGHGSSTNVVFEFEIEDGLYNSVKVTPFAEGLGVPVGDVTLNR